MFAAYRSHGYTENVPVLESTSDARRLGSCLVASDLLLRRIANGVLIGDSDDAGNSSGRLHERINVIHHGTHIDDD